MLKIREYDDLGNTIDLKELEKFGFKEYDKGYYKKWYAEPFGICVWEIHNDTRKIIGTIYDNPTGDCYFETEIDDTLYDLIKADLVEKEVK